MLIIMYSLLVVDDEKIIRTGIINEIKTSFCFIGDIWEAEDGDQALDIVARERPDIIITDINMPKINGLDFISSAKDINEYAKIVIISGYDEFEYAQRALKLGVEEYLLKPIEKEQLRQIILNIIEAIEKQNKLFYDMERLKSIVQESLPAARERFFNNVVSGRLMREEIIKKVDYLNIDMSGVSYCAGILKFSMDGEEVNKEDLLLGTLESIKSDVFGEDITAYFFFVNVDEIGIIFASKCEDISKTFLIINTNLGNIIYLLKRQFNISLKVALGGRCVSVEHIAKSYKEAEQALEYSLLNNNQYIINYADICEKEAISLERPIEIENSIIFNTKSCNASKVNKCIDELFSYYEAKSNINASTIKKQVFELIINLSREVEEMVDITEDSIDHVELKRFEKIFKADRLEQLIDSVKAIAADCIDKINKTYYNKSVSTIKKVMGLIAAGYSDSEFSLEDVAGKLYISPNYLRQLFKQQTGKSFVEYITVFRMEKAASLLEDRLLKVQDVAEKVGFNDYRYFAACFKKHFKMTPSEYREAQELFES
jgi:two-component system, response regulator YesN